MIFSRLVGSETGSSNPDSISDFGLEEPQAGSSNTSAQLCQDFPVRVRGQAETSGAFQGISAALSSLACGL